MDNEEKIKKRKYDPNVVGLEQSSEESTSESDNEASDDEPEIVNGHSSKENEILNTENKVEIVETETKTDAAEMNATSKIDVILIEDESDSNKTKKNKNFNKKVKKEIKVEKKPLLDHPTVHVEVKRDPKIQVARLKLPILGEEQRIMELINENDCVIIAGETGIQHL